MAEKQEAKKAPQERGPQKVETIAQAVHVLVQAADMGRKAGIFDWQDLDVIMQSMDLLTAKPGPQQEVADKMNEEAESAEEQEAPVTNYIAEEE